MELYIVIIES